MRLILIPTALERERVPFEMRLDWAKHGNAIELCGFGAVVSGIQTSRWIEHYHPAQVILLGIAGSYTTELAPGSAIEFNRVSCFGIGVGDGDGYRGASELGWDHWPFAPVISDSIALTEDAEHERELLSVTSASASTLEIGIKTRAFPAALAEDMEGFSVAAACRLTETPLRIVRGISNFAGERNHRDWKIDSSLQAAMELVLQPN